MPFRPAGVEVKERLGRFHVKLAHVDRFPELVRQLMADVLILEATQHYDTRSIHYLGEGPAFALIHEGTRAPIYGVVEVTEPDLRSGHRGLVRLVALRFSEFPER